MAFPVAARSLVGEWLSLVEHLVRDQGVGGSNPLSPTNSLFSQNSLLLSYKIYCESGCKCLRMRHKRTLRGTIVFLFDVMCGKIVGRSDQGW